MEMNTYDGFDDWNDVLKQFGGNAYEWSDDETKQKFEDLKTREPEPRKVYHARYDHGGYDGAATVIWQRGEKFYLLQGSHCSCYGLEEAGFEPEEFESKTLFVEYLKRINWMSAMTDEERVELIKKLER